MQAFECAGLLCEEGGWGPAGTTVTAGGCCVRIDCDGEGDTVDQVGWCVLHEWLGRNRKVAWVFGEGEEEMFVWLFESKVEGASVC